MNSRGTRSVDYGQDAPGIRFMMGIIAVVGAVMLAAARATAVTWREAPLNAIRAISVLGLFALLYGAWMSAYMTWSSKIGKRRTRDELLQRVARIRPWTGSEIVIDVGCGRGLMLIGAAKKLDSGTAIGLDVWREEDQAGNSPEAVIENARREGVAHRVSIRTADARNLPLADASVDVVLSHWLVHNLKSEHDRGQALGEMWRVLRPGGVLALADIEYVPAYMRHLSASGAVACDLLDGGWEARIMGMLSGGSYTPQAMICSKPRMDESI